MHSRSKLSRSGGGIGGLAFAVALGKYSDIDITIYESAPVFSEIGAGVGVWPRIWRTLQKLELTEALKKATHKEPKEGLTDTFQFRKSDQREGHDIYKLQTDGNFLTYHRAHFQNVLVENLPSSVKIHYNMHLKRYEQNASGNSAVTLHFADGTTFTHDLVVGCDGIKSTVRRQVLTEQASNAATPEEAQEILDSIPPQWTGLVAYRNLVPVERLKEYQDAHPELNIRVPQADSIPRMYLGKNVNVVIYAIAQGKLINVASFHAQHELAGTKFPGPWVTNVDKQELIDVHEGWEEEVHAIINCTESPARWAIHASAPLKCWNSGHVALLGDSAHAMSPQQASGGGQAIEDAYVLATLLGHRLTNKTNIRRALSIYDNIRRPGANLVAEKSLLQGRLYGLNLPGEPDLDWSKCPERLHEIGDAIYENWSWTWNSSLEPFVEKAVSDLEKSEEIFDKARKASLQMSPDNTMTPLF
ncbi:FAD/NAD(P)-binding domain-containing protein [Pterulicium gracile]|uniref:FAD/NAD(P)-binding domain-containing protein n=1 Tax=Pterulicium gracile TaxID=1884261 RepID=A0A5C3Q238_9AGAR|nr:FAD/NAD(P)-binding domain-containing protein [Pterula gracilis]